MGNYFGDGSDGNVIISSNTQISNTQDGDYVVMNYNSLTINSGYTLTTQYRCKGLIIYVKQACEINGILSMTKRGGYGDPSSEGVSSTGIRLPIITETGSETLSSADFSGCGTGVQNAVANQSGIDGNGEILTIERTGGSGGPYPGNDSDGNTGGTKTDGTGGGGSGSEQFSRSEHAGAGGAGTCFSGGAGGGGKNDDGWNAGAGSSIGGAGGNASGKYHASGGAGNPGGGGINGGGSGQDGIGGVLWLIVGGNLSIGGTLEAKGARGGESSAAGGGGSGGGIIKAIYGGSLVNSGTIDVGGGSGGICSTSDSSWQDGGDGGNGSYEIISALTGSGVLQVITI